MPQTNPNRNKKQSVHNQQKQKQSGDQHFFPEDDSALDPYRPHRMSREDMQKITGSEPDIDETDFP